MNITFRDYTSEDKELLKDFLNKLEEHIKSIDPLGRIKNFPGHADILVEKASEYLEKYQGKIIFAEDDGKVVGIVTGYIWEQSAKNKLEIGEHKLGHVYDLYIEEEYRGKGLGSQMLEMMENYFKEKGCDSIWIEVFADNTGAYNLYKTKGYTPREIGMLKEIK